LASAPSQIVELLDRGDDFAAVADDRAAMAFYQSALKLAGAGSIPPDLHARLSEAHAFIARRVENFQGALSRSPEGLEPGDPGRTRLTHGLEMLRGEREIFLQEPSVLYTPYLAQRQFFEREEFDWVPALEAATPLIRAELNALLESGDPSPFRPYVEDEANRPVRDFAGLNNDPRWSALYLWRDGKLNESIASRFPRTLEALSHVPLSDIGQRTPAALFSRLEPGAHIPPHHGMLNCRLICHLPIIVPAGCWLRVGNETREWEEGKLLLFDDSIQHEARNPTGELRIVLLFDIWRPELTAGERRGISTIFRAIDSFQSLPDA
jgi:hypothetical protein